MKKNKTYRKNTQQLKCGERVSYSDSPCPTNDPYMDLISNIHWRIIIVMENIY